MLLLRFHFSHGFQRKDDWGSFNARFALNDPQQ